MEIADIKLADLRQPALVLEQNPSIVPLQQVIPFQLPQNPVGMDRGQTERVCNDRLR